MIKYLQSEKTYAIHRPWPIHFKRLKTVPTGLGEFQCDLAILDKLKTQQQFSLFARLYRYFI